MKQLAWLASAAVLFAGVLIIEGWPAYKEMARNREWRIVEAAPDGATLQGLRVAVHTQVAAIAGLRPERAALFVRLELRATPAARTAWTGCAVSLRDAAGQVWTPLVSATTDGAIKTLAPDRKNHGPCNLYSENGGQGEETLYADQIFMLPSDGLQDLRLHVSGLGTRPNVLVFALEPEIRRLQ